MAKSMEKVFTHGLMEASTMVTGTKIKFMARESIYGETAEDTKVNGVIIRCMDMVYIRGKMVENMKETT
jgi:hypothetical protein